MALSWKGLEEASEARALRGLVRRLREFMKGRAHNYADGVIIEGHIGERLGSIQLLTIDGQNQLLVSLACGRSPSLQILPIGTKRTPGLEAYTEPDHSVGRLHSIWTNDVSSVAGLLSNEDNLQTIRKFCLHRASSLRIGNGTIEFHGPLSSSGDDFENIRSTVLQLAGIARAFERERVHLPRSHAREIAIVIAAAVGVILFTALAAPSVRALFPRQKEEVQVVHYQPTAQKAWRPVSADDFDADDQAFFNSYHETPGQPIYLDFDGSGQQSGTVQIYRRSDNENAPFRVVCYDHGQQLSDDVFPTLAFALRINAKDLKNAKWIGTGPAKLPIKGEALLAVGSRKELGSGMVYIFDNGTIKKYPVVDYRFP
jgi:hypothetical protein